MYYVWILCSPDDSVACVFGSLRSVPLTSLARALATPSPSLAGDEEFLFGSERGGRVCLLHVVSARRVDLLRGRGLCAVLLQHHHWQTGENPHGTVRPHSTCRIDVRCTALKVCSLVRPSVIDSVLKDVAFF